MFKDSEFVWVDSDLMITFYRLLPQKFEISGYGNFEYVGPKGDTDIWKSVNSGVTVQALKVRGFAK